jgi:hypothetical protein
MEGNLLRFPGTAPEEDEFEKATNELWVAIANGYHNEELNVFIESLPHDSELRMALIAFKHVALSEAYTI